MKVSIKKWTAVGFDKWRGGGAERKELRERESERERERGRHISPTKINSS